MGEPTHMCDNCAKLLYNDCYLECDHDGTKLHFCNADCDNEHFYDFR